MLRTPVVSSTVAEVGYDEATQTLEVSFHKGGVYQYDGVPPSIANGLLNAASVGGYLASHVKPHYGYRRVG